MLQGYRRILQSLGTMWAMATVLFNSVFMLLETIHCIPRILSGLPESSLLIKLPCQALVGSCALLCFRVHATFWLIKPHHDYFLLLVTMLGSAVGMAQTLYSTPVLGRAGNYVETLVLINSASLVFATMLYVLFFRFTEPADRPTARLVSKLRSSLQSSLRSLWSPTLRQRFVEDARILLYISDMAYFALLAPFLSNNFCLSRVFPQHSLSAALSQMAAFTVLSLGTVALILPLHERLEPVWVSLGYFFSVAKSAAAILLPGLRNASIVLVWTEVGVVGTKLGLNVILMVDRWVSGEGEEMEEELDEDKEDAGESKVEIELTRTERSEQPLGSESPK